jgi:hypothetical protein
MAKRWVGLCGGFVRILSIDWLKRHFWTISPNIDGFAWDYVRQF